MEALCSVLMSFKTYDTWSFAQEAMYTLIYHFLLLQREIKHFPVFKKYLGEEFSLFVFVLAPYEI